MAEARKDATTDKRDAEYSIAKEKGDAMVGAAEDNCMADAKRPAKSNPACLVHVKTMVVDGMWGTIGSTNFDNRSFALNQELNLTVYDRTVANRLEEIFYEDLK